MGYYIPGYTISHRPHRGFGKRKWMGQVNHDARDFYSYTRAGVQRKVQRAVRKNRLTYPD